MSTQEKECICGATIFLVSDFKGPEGEDWWIDSRGEPCCYPEAENPMDRVARHEPYQPEGEG